MTIDDLLKKGKAKLDEGLEKARAYLSELEKKSDEGKLDEELIEKGTQAMIGLGELTKKALASAAKAGVKTGAEIAAYGVAGTAERKSRKARAVIREGVEISKEKYAAIKDDFLAHSADEDGKVDAERAGSYLGGMTAKGVESFVKFVVDYSATFKRDPAKPATLEDREMGRYGRVGSALEEHVEKLSWLDVQRCKNLMRKIEYGVKDDEVRDQVIRTVCELAIRDKETLKGFYEKSGNPFAVSWVEKNI